MRVLAVSCVYPIRSATERTNNDSNDNDDMNQQKLSMMWVLSLLVLALWTPAAECDEGKKSAEGTVVKTAWDRRVPELTWNDISLAQVGEELGHLFSEVNFVVPKSIAKETVSLTGRSVTLAEILKGIHLASDGRIVIQGVEESSVGDQNLVSFSRAPDAGREKPAARKNVVRAFSLKPYLAGFPPAQGQEIAIESLREAVAIAVDLVAKSTKGVEGPNLQFHRETGLLIAEGQPEVIEVVQEIVRELGSASKASRP